MHISLNWIRDFVDLPDDLDPRELAERFTCTTAEVDGLERIDTGAGGLIAARVLQVAEIPESRNLRLITLDVGDDKTRETVSAAPVMRVGDSVVYAPPGAKISAFQELGSVQVAGKTSNGMILPGEAVGIAMAFQEAVFLEPSISPGQPLAAEQFDDWVMEVDNKSITNRPDLWGHYGIAREVAAIFGLALKPYPVVALESIVRKDLKSVAISIADSAACPRYSALVFEGVPTQPAPLWMQLRLGHVGMRPISGLVDLTNYVMAELGQPMHAFDAGKVDGIEVARANAGEKFRTLDGVERSVTTDDLMIQSAGNSVALAGVMGGLETEISEDTTLLLLESANFDAVAVRKTATRLALRTDASARFEKSLDPAHTVLGIQRFMALAEPMYPELRLTHSLSDCYPAPAAPVTVAVNPKHIDRALGRPVKIDEIKRLLQPLGFVVRDEKGAVEIDVPSYRATGDIAIEADVVEEIARYIGYNSIESVMPSITMRRFETNALHELEQQTLRCFTSTHGFNEIHGYLWYDTPWLAQIGFDPGECVELKNPAADGLHRLRGTLVPGLLASVVKNRFHFTDLRLLELGSAFKRCRPEDIQTRHLGLVRAERGKGLEIDLLADLKGTIEAWSFERFGGSVRFTDAAARSERPWEDAARIASINIGDRVIGSIGVVERAARRAMDDHLTSWSIVWAELCLSGLETIEQVVEPIQSIPEHPQIEMDFSVLVPKSERFEEVTTKVASLKHPLLKRLQFLGSYEGKAISSDKRSFTFRTIVGDDSRTLVDEDANGFREAFEQHAQSCGYEIRR